jgi:hypothetical protein
LDKKPRMEDPPMIQFSNVTSISPVVLANGQQLNQTYLPIDFKLTENDVYCGRGVENEGNQKFREIIVANLVSYCDTTSRFKKTCLLNKIIHEVKLNCKESGSGIGFVGKDHNTQRYYEVGEYKAVRFLYSFTLFFFNSPQLKINSGVFISFIFSPFNDMILKIILVA